MASLRAYVREGATVLAILSAAAGVAISAAAVTTAAMIAFVVAIPSDGALMTMGAVIVGMIGVAFIALLR